MKHFQAKATASVPPLDPHRSTVGVNVLADRLRSGNDVKQHGRTRTATDGHGLKDNLFQSLSACVRGCPCPSVLPQTFGIAKRSQLRYPTQRDANRCVFRHKDRKVLNTVIPLPRRMPDVLAVGAFLKNTLCAIRHDRATITPAIGNLELAAAIADFERQATGLIGDLGLEPRLIAHDLHPDFYSTRWAEAHAAPAVAVQHHHAHIAAVAAEHGVEGPLIGLALDGFGLGPDNQSWGGELLWVDGPVYRRLGHLALLAQPGGDLAARQPWRMAAAVLHRLGRGDEIASRFAAQPAASRLARIIAQGVNSPPTSSAGRLFDAACGLLGVYPVADFEGQAPMALEALAVRPRAMEGGWTIADGVLDCLPLLEALIGRDPADGAELFHGTLIAALAQWAAEAADRTGIDTIAMGGGCLFNTVLRQGLVDALAKRGLAALLPLAASPGDPGLESRPGLGCRAGGRTSRMNDRRSLSLRLSLFYAALFTVFGVQLPFWPLYLSAKGIGAAEIGQILAATYLIRILTNPLVGHAVDTGGGRRRPLIVLASVSLASTGLFAFADGFAALLGVTLISSSAFTAMMPVGDSLTLQCATTHRLDYGRVRLWGSLSFIAVASLAGMTLVDAPRPAILWACLAGLALTLAAAALLPDIRLERPKVGRIPWLLCWPAGLSCCSSPPPASARSAT